MDFHKFRYILQGVGYEFPADSLLAKQLHRVIVKMRPRERWELVDRIGWYGDEFILPNRPVRVDDKVNGKPPFG